MRHKIWESGEYRMRKRDVDERSKARAKRDETNRSPV